MAPIPKEKAMTKATRATKEIILKM
jgi:hypothetical protein